MNAHMTPVLYALCILGCAGQREAPPDAKVAHGGDGGGTGTGAKPDARPDDGTCGPWATGTLTGYNNSNLADDPNAGSVMEFRGLTDPFYDHVDMAAVDMSDWGGDSYHWVDVDFGGVVGRVGVWDACADADCPDGEQCCTNNKKLFATPGYLVDVETRTAARLWGVQDAEDTLRDKIQFRVCGTFDPDVIAEMYGAHR
jgi:hypothetical protein